MKCYTCGRENSSYATRCGCGSDLTGGSDPFAYGQQSQNGYGQQYGSGYGQAPPSGYDQQFSTGYGQQPPAYGYGRAAGKRSPAVLGIAIGGGVLVLAVVIILIIALTGGFSEKLSGTYVIVDAQGSSEWDGMEYVFEGNEYSVRIFGIQYMTGTYRLSGDEITFRFYDTLPLIGGIYSSIVDTMLPETFRSMLSARYDRHNDTITFTHQMFGGVDVTFRKK